METTYNYILQSGLCLLLLYVFYVLVLRSFPGNGFNRFYLLVAPLLALVIPFLKLPLLFVQKYLPAAALPGFSLPEVTVTAYLPPQTATPDTVLSLNFILTIVYAVAAFILLARLLYQLLQLYKLAKSATTIQKHTSGATILQTKSHATFAFMHYIFLEQQPHLTAREQKQVLAHELAHVRLGHSYDVLYYELLTAILWFNPLVWLLKTELRDVHEYQADAAVATEYKPDAYTALLAKEALYRSGIPVGNYFYRPQVFKRLQRLQQRNRHTTIVRPLLAVPLLLFMVFIFSPKDVTADMVGRLTEPVTDQLTTHATPETINGPLVAPPENITPETIASTDKKPEAVEMPVFKEAPPTAADKKEPYEYVEQMPVFEGGEMELQKFIASQMRYPQATREAGNAGLVVLNFVVQPDGHLTDLKILKGLDKAADAEAIRVISATSGKWSAGLQDGMTVPVRYTLPVRFTLMH